MNKILSNYKNLNSRAQKQLLELFQNQGQIASTQREDDGKPVDVADVQISLDEDTTRVEDDKDKDPKKINLERADVQLAQP